jgi:chromatin remodeling complex protein RSC6
MKGAGIKKPMRCSEELRAIVKEKKLPRGQVVKALWKYIKKHHLQSSKDGRIIKCDDKLKAIFKSIIKKDRKLVVRKKKFKIPAGRIFMTEMGKGLTRHLS